MQHQAFPNASAPRVVRLTAAEDDTGSRIDNFLLRQLKGVPRSHVYRLIRSGEVRVNSRRVRPEYRIEEGDLIRIPPVDRRGSAGAGPPRPGRVRAEWIRGHLLFEDGHFLVLDKPAGLAVHGGSGISLGAIELLRAVYGPKERLELVHRLDRDTSGCLLVARRGSALRHLHAQFREGTVDKRYLALLVGRWPGRARTVDAPLLTDERRGGERHVRVDGAGKPALTRFLPLERFREAALMDVQLGTGRTHQIRVHAASIGHPVAGDTRYGVPGDAVARRHGLERLFLHARSLVFVHPLTGDTVTVEAPMDAALHRALDSLRAAEAG